MSDTSLHLYAADTSTVLSLPYADEGIHAGFPSPAQDYMAESIDLNKEFIHNKETTFFARVEGNSMSGAGAAYLDGEFTLKQFKLDPKNRCAWLVPYNPDYAPIQVTETDDFRIWGVVTSIIRRLRK